ncbi:MAG: flagellar basal body rod protein FlgC [Lachnospiraceae bacterium]|nr:flagellar basal body rod protein FlgC [Lachnospiraceae bacterium]
MSMFSAFNINASGMTAQRYRMDIISENVANANTTRTADGTPYRRKIVTFEEKGGQTSFSRILGKAAYSHGYTGQGVKVSGVYEDHKTPMNMVYDPSHPDADENGYVTGPNVNIITEMTNMIDASRAWEANSTAFNTSKSIAVKGLELMNS